MATTPADTLAVGDKVILRDAGVRGVRSVRTVARLTKTRVMILDRGRERAFQRGRYMDEIGSFGYHPASLQIGTPAELAEVADEQWRRVLVASILAVKLDDLSTAELEALAAEMPERYRRTPRASGP